MLALWVIRFRQRHRPSTRSWSGLHRGEHQCIRIFKTRRNFGDCCSRSQSWGTLQLFRVALSFVAAFAQSPGSYQAGKRWAMRGYRKSEGSCQLVMPCGLWRSGAVHLIGRCGESDASQHAPAWSQCSNGSSIAMGTRGSPGDRRPLPAVGQATAPRHVPYSSRRLEQSQLHREPGEVRDPAGPTLRTSRSCSRRPLTRRAVRVRRGKHKRDLESPAG